VKLLAFLTDQPENAKEVANTDLAARCVDAIDNKSIAGAESLRDLYSDVLNLAENLIQSGADIVKDKFVSESTHVKVLSRAASIADGGKLNETSEADLLSKIFNFVKAMMQGSVQVLKDCCTSFHIIDTLCKVLAMHSIDPKVLKSSCICLTLILENREMYDQYCGIVVERLQKVAPLLDFLGGKRFPDLYRRAMKYSADEESRSAAEEEGAKIPALNQLSNTMVCEAFLGIIELVAFFAQVQEEGQEDSNRKLVSQAMETANREQVLLRLLLVPSDEIKLAVMKCITTMPVDQIEPEEMGMVIKAISNTRNVGEGKAEEVLAKLVVLLGRLVQDTKKPGREFRKTYAKIAIAEVYETLVRNSQRETQGSESEENQKSALSVAIVKFLRLCGQRPTLRKLLRSPEICNRFPEVMKNEEELHTAQAEDIGLEQTWIGRSLENLLACLTGEKALHPRKRVTFRVLSRMADVLEGRTDALRPSEILSLEDLKQRESQMWPFRDQLARHHRHLDDDEWTDRKAQALSFIRLGGITTIRELLSGVKVREDARELMGKFSDAEFERVQLMNSSEKQPALAFGDEEQLPIETETLSGRDAVMTSLQCSAPPPDEHSRNLFAVRPAHFESSEELWESMEEKTLHYVWALSAFLRILHALIIVPPTEYIFAETIKDLNLSATINRLIAMVQQVPCLSCDLSAKLLRLQSYVMQSGLEVSMNSDLGVPRPRNIRYMTDFIKTHAEKMMHLLKLTTHRCLAPNEERLVLEMARYMALVMPATRLLVRRGLQQQHRDGKVEDSVRSQMAGWMHMFVPDIFIRLFIGMTIYELQMDAGGGKRAEISREFMQTRYARLGLKESCTNFLTNLLVIADSDSAYSVLELFSIAEVFQGQTIRPCYLTGVFMEMSLGQYMTGVEDWLHRKAHLKHEHHITRFELMDFIETGLESRPELKLSVIFCATTDKLLVLQPVAEGNLARWDPSKANPDGKPHPQIIYEYSYSDIDRMYRCLGSQLLVIHWKPVLKNSRGNRVFKGRNRDGFDGTRYWYCGEKDPNFISGQCGPEVGPQCPACQQFQSAGEVDTGRPRVSLFAFHRMRVRDDCANVLRRYTADRDHERAQIVNDPRIRKEVIEHDSIKGTQVLAVTLAMSVSQQASRRPWGKAAQSEFAPLLFVLGEKAAMSFSLTFQNWQLPNREDTYFDDGDDFVPKDLFSELATKDDIMKELPVLADTSEAARGDSPNAIEDDPKTKDRMAHHLERLHEDRGPGAQREEMPALPAPPAPPQPSPWKLRTCGAVRTSPGVGKKAVLEASGKVLEKEEEVCLVPITEAVFEPYPQAELKLTGDKSIAIRFFDDPGREAWRRGLAYLTAASGKGFRRGDGAGGDDGQTAP